jgi:hypothetical protein
MKTPTKFDKKSIKQHILSNGFVTIDKDGGCYFVVTQINDENFNDISPMLKQQLEDEGKYNSWIGFTAFKAQVPYSVQMLPIYGNSKKYVTKWFTDTAEEAINQDLNDRQFGLLKRANDYIENSNG